MAKDAGISLEEFMRRAATSHTPLAEVAILERMTELLNKSTARAESAIDDVLTYVEASNIRIGEMENREKTEPYEHKLVHRGGNHAEWQGDGSAGKEFVSLIMSK